MLRLLLFVGFMVAALALPAAPETDVTLSGGPEALSAAAMPMTDGMCAETCDRAGSRECAQACLGLAMLPELEEVGPRGAEIAMPTEPPTRQGRSPERDPYPPKHPIG